MKGLGEFFTKIQNRQIQEVTLRTQIKETIKKHAGVDVSLDGMTFRGTKIILNKITSTEKSQVMIKKLAILKELQSRIPDRIISDIS